MSNAVKLTYYQSNKDLMLKKTKEYYHANKDKINKRLRDKYKELPEENKIKRREYGKNWRDNMSEEQKIKAKNRYRCLPEEDKNKITEYARNRYHTLIKTS